MYVRLGSVTVLLERFEALENVEIVVGPSIDGNKFIGEILTGCIER